MRNIKYKWFVFLTRFLLKKKKKNAQLKQE